jgi:SSS family solute:Na+ symporter
MLTAVHIIGIVLTVGILLAVSILSGGEVKDARSFTTGGRAGSWMVCGAILGTLVGGQSTIGTAQLAFSYGLSAWWFTIGAALGALMLGLVYAGPLRHSGCSTLMEVVRKQYGRRAETVGSILFLIGIFISITSQLLSSSAMITSLFGLPLGVALVVGAVLIAALVFFGGIKSAGAGGIVKLVLLYVSSLAAGIAVWTIGNGLTGIRESISAIYETPRLAAMNDLSCAEDIHRRYGTFLARGPLKDLGGCLSLTLGVVCTQTYAQAIWSASTTHKARRGAVYCAALIPLIGAACTLVGMYMRGHYVTAAEAAALQRAGECLPAGIGVLENSLQAFPTFIIAHLPAWLGGIALGTLLINILGCGSGLVLGAATILIRDVYGNLMTVLRRTPRLGQLAQTRLSILLLLALGVVAAHFVRGSFINDLGFLSLGLRAAALLLPLSFALWLPGRFRPRAITLSMVTGTAVMLLAGLLHLPADPMYYGLLASAVILLPAFKKH